MLFNNRYNFIRNILGQFRRVWRMVLMPPAGDKQEKWESIPVHRNVEI
jgi:hypothetical protein